MSKSLKALLAFLLVAPAFAQDGAVTLDHVDGLVGSYLLVDTDVSFYFRLTNYTDDRYGPTNAFRLWSPDGAMWDYPSKDTVWVEEDFRTRFSQFWVFIIADGMDSDTLGFVGSFFSEGAGMPPGYDGVPYRINLIARAEDTGRHICIDSSVIPIPSGQWKWENLAAGSPDIYPGWDGPHCFTITDNCCEGEMTGNVDHDQGDIIDIGDLAALIDFLLISFAEPPCIAEANIDGDPEGTVDIGDLTRLIDYLFISFDEPAPCP